MDEHNTGDRMVGYLCLFVAGFLVAEFAGVFLERWHEMQFQRSVTGQTVCAQQDDKLICSDLQSRVPEWVLR